ncbi:MAG: hypothetical protein K2Q15_15475, partial [Burkholderiales bacterium]|nr:hypothetical protein [Burkholderiales bacterium]
EEDEVMIVLTDTTSEVELYEETTWSGFDGGVYLESLAKDLESYLGALLCATVNRRHFLPGMGDEPGLKAQWKLLAQICTQLAGGEKYASYWHNHCGVY